MAAATAPGWTRSAGWVPALAAGAPVVAVHRPAASWERAELAVHTNSTGPVTRRHVVRGARAGVDQVDVASAPVAAGAAALDQPGRLEDVEVVGEQVGRHTDELWSSCGDRSEAAS